MLRATSLELTGLAACRCRITVVARVARRWRDPRPDPDRDRGRGRPSSAAVGFAFWSVAGLVIVFAGVGIVGAVAQRMSRPVA